MEPGRRLYEALLSAHDNPAQLQPWGNLSAAARANLAADEERRIHTSRVIDDLAQRGYERARTHRAENATVGVWSGPPWAELAGDLGAMTRRLWRAGARFIRAEVQQGAQGAHGATDALIDHMAGGKVEEALLAQPSASAGASARQYGAGGVGFPGTGEVRHGALAAPEVE